MKTEIFHMKNALSEKPGHMWTAKFLSQNPSFLLQVTEIRNCLPNWEV